MPTVSGTFLRSDGTPSSGSVAFAPSVAIGDHAEVRLPAPCEVHLDAAGAFEVTLPATNDPAYTPAGWVWEVRERIAGGRDAWHFELTADADYWDLTTVLPPDDYLPWTFTATATTGAPGTDADVDVTGLPPSPVFEFTIPRGDQGDPGDEGPPNVLTIGTVTTEAPGAPATAAITGTSPAQVLNLGIPEGDKGDQGDPGPTTDLSVGTVTTGAPGSSAAADITGTPPTLQLDLTIPRGDVGETGPANELTIGTVTTGAAGSSAAATITGTPPSQTLDLAIPQGLKGDTGNIAPANVGNLLSMAAHGITDATGWKNGIPTGASTLFASVALSTAQAYNDTNSLACVTTGTGGNAVSAVTAALTGANIATVAIPLIRNTPVTGSVRVRTAATGETVRLTGYWYLASGSAASTAATNVGDQLLTADTWTEIRGTLVPPADAVYWVLAVRRVSGAAGVTIFVDYAGAWCGAGGIAVPPGIPVPGLGTRANPADATQVQVWNVGNSTWITV